MELRGKTVWLIGASTGIGEALARALAAEGATLTLSARDGAKLSALQQSLPGSGHRVAALDVTDMASVEAAWAQVNTAPVDLVIYNAGAYEPMSAMQFDLARVEQMVDVNFSGALRVLAQVLPAFIARNAGHIALVASVAGYRGLPGAMGYGASKAALMHLCENLRADLTGSGVGVTVINPGFVKTRLTDKNDFRMPAMITPEQAAAAIVAGLNRDEYEIHFPKRFTRVLKFLQLLPHGLYFRALRSMKM
jgi:short-subunit dehydrogenase